MTLTRASGLLSLALLVLVPAALFSQALPEADPLMPEDYDPSEFPLWVRDLRRYEVVSIGSFPISFFVTSLVYDFSVYAANNFSSEYSIGSRRGGRDIAVIAGTAAGVSLIIATADLIINILQRSSGGSNEQRNPDSPDS